MLLLLETMIFLLPALIRN